VIQPNSPSVFSTPAVGLDFVILDEEGREGQSGEVFIRPPSIGLSTHLLNRDHHAVYFQGGPRDRDGTPLRRHGDQLERLPGGRFRAQGRSDDTMNLSGIKVSSAEIERALIGIDGVSEIAAVACSPSEGGPEKLAVYCVLSEGAVKETGALLDEMRKVLREQLNPLFKIEELAMVDSLPRTESNKVIRRRLRDQIARADE
jgi:acetyl-CoA synthetase